MRKVNYEKMIELLSFVLHCPVCSNKYNAEQTSIIEARETEKFEDASMLVHMDCERCRSSVFFSIALEGPEIFSVGMVTDLTSSDARKFREAAAVSVDEVIDFHRFMSEFDGDFEKVLN